MYNVTHLGIHQTTSNVTRVPSSIPSIRGSEDPHNMLQIIASLVYCFLKQILKNLLFTVYWEQNQTQDLSSLKVIVVHICDRLLRQSMSCFVSQPKPPLCIYTITSHGHVFIAHCSHSFCQLPLLNYPHTPKLSDGLLYFE